MHRQSASAGAIQSAAATLRVYIAELAAEDLGDAAVAERIGDQLVSLAKLEGQLKVYALVDSLYATYERPDAQVRGYLTQWLLQGADDTWSGRGNDLKRAHHDGVRNATREVLDTIGWEQ